MYTFYQNFIKQKFSGLISQLIDYPTPITLSYLWSFGSLSGIFLLIQIITGIILAMHYVPNIDYAFFSVEHIMRDVNYGWFIRSLHANGASFFFITVYLHIGRGLYYGSFLKPRHIAWIVGVLIFIIMMATAFIGYVLPWGQMSFWGATVITNLFSAIPYVGEDLVFWIWGGYSVNNATLNRFFSLHYLLPMLLSVVVILHIYILHIVGSSDPLNINFKIDSYNVPFYSFFYVKDLLGFLCIIFVYLYFVFFSPDALGHPDNYIEANSLVTPAHIVPEWYFLPFYAILRSIPNKLAGVLCMGFALISLILLPFITSLSLKSSTYKSTIFNLYYRVSICIFFSIVVVLGWLGGQPVEDPYIVIGMILTFLYFFFLFVLFPLCLNEK